MIALDNQAAISTVANNARQPGQYLLDKIHAQLQDLRHSHQHLRIHLEWVPGHSGLAGNETADELARDAALTQQPDGLPVRLTHPLPVSIAALKAACKLTMLPMWKAMWQSSP